MLQYATLTMKNLEIMSLSQFKNYYNIENLGTLEQFRHIYDHNKSQEVDFISRPQMEAYFTRGSSRDYFLNMNYDLTLEDLGPFKLEGKELQYFLSNLTSFSITYHLKHNIPSSAAAPFDCFIWKIDQEFDYFNRNHITQRVLVRRNYCSPDETGTNILTRYIWLNL